MNAEQKKRRDELADKYSDNGQQHEDYLNGYDAGFKDSEIHKASCCMDMELENAELKRKLEVAKKALKRVTKMHLGQNSESAIDGFFEWYLDNGVIEEFYDSRLTDNESNKEKK